MSHPNFTPSFAPSSRLAMGFVLAGKRPFQDDPTIIAPAVPGSIVTEGSPPKRPSSGGQTVKERSISSIAHYHPYLPQQPSMAVQNGDQSADHGYGYQNGNGTAVNGDAGNSPEFLVVLFGCSGYGELAMKCSIATGMSSSMSGISPCPMNGGGSVNGVSNGAENLAGYLWDEEAALVLLAWAVVDVKSNKVVVVEERLIRPRDENERTLHESFLLQSGLDAGKISTSPYTIERVLQQIGESVRSHGGSRNEDIVLVTLGPELLRQQLLPECARHTIQLPDYFFTYVDLLDNTAHTSSTTSSTSLSKRLADLLENNHLQSDASVEYGKRTVFNMAQLVQCMVQSRHNFGDPQHINRRYEPGLSAHDKVADDVVVRARGLPWQASDMDVARFFYGLDIPRGGIALCLSSHGRRNGEAIVVFASSQQRDLALQRHKHHMTNRYIEVYKAVAEDFQQVAGVCNTEAEQFLRRKGDVIIRMRGLPYEATAKEVVDFFANGDHPIYIVDGEEGVLFVKRPDGRAAGDAFVILGSEEDGQTALAKHRERIGNRYIELFRSTTAEVQQVLNKTLDVRNDNQIPLIATPPAFAGLMGQLSPQLLMQAPSLMGGGGVKNCIRLRGLPFEATVEDILMFLGDKAKHIVVQGVHMVYNAQGQPSGEAYIQMDSEYIASLTCQGRHNQWMNMAKYGKKNRYVEVYQCSADEMHRNGLGSMRPLMSNGFPGMNPYQATFPFNTNLPLVMQGLSSAGLRSNPGLSGLYSLPYWSYPSPPVSPTTTFPANMTAITNSQLAALGIGTAGTFPIVHMRNLPYNAGVSDVLAFFNGVAPLSADLVQLTRNPDGRQNGEALVAFTSREDAERAIQERNRQNLGNRRVDMTLLA